MTVPSTALLTEMRRIDAQIEQAMKMADQATTTRFRADMSVVLKSLDKQRRDYSTAYKLLRDKNL